MKLVGFGCSFTYGSELLDPDLVEGDDGHHYDNIPYREKHCWLGQLAEMLGCSFDTVQALQEVICSYKKNLVIGLTCILQTMTI